MRPNYPISSKQNQIELRTIHEHLTKLLGYDANPYDDVLDKEGTYDVIEDQIDADALTMLEKKLYPAKGTTPIYTHVFRADALFNLRRTNGQ